MPISLTSAPGLLQGKAAEPDDERNFDPDVARAYEELCRDELFAQEQKSAGLRQKVLAMEPQSVVKYVDQERLENIASAFAEIVDSKSTYTARHSEDVALITQAIARKMGFPEEEVTKVRFAALLHDLGKLSVPNTILDKPDKPSPEEWQSIQKHPYYTQKILEPIQAFNDIAEMACSHHERMDGKGYFRGLPRERILPAGRVIAVADVYQALSVDRPYRPRLDTDHVLDIMSNMQDSHLSGECLSAFKSIL